MNMLYTGGKKEGIRLLFCLVLHVVLPFSGLFLRGVGWGWEMCCGGFVGGGGGYRWAKWSTSNLNMQMLSRGAGWRNNAAMRENTEQNSNVIKCLLLLASIIEKLIIGFRSCGKPELSLVKSQWKKGSEIRSIVECEVTCLQWKG